MYAETYWNYNPYTTEGKEFYVTFMKNGGAETGAQALNFFLYASTRSQAATITVYDAKTETKITEFNCTKTIVGRTNEGEINDENAFLENSNTIYDRVLKVTSNTNISLYASNYNNQSYGAFNVLPIEALSKEYIIQTYGSDVEATQFAIIATQDNTIVHITPSDTIKWGDESFSIDPQVITLNKGQAYQIHANQPHDNLSGTIVCSKKPIAIFNGGQTTQITNDASSQDHIVEQSLPTYMWGKEFIVANSKVQDFNIVKITAMYDNTRIQINNQIDTILNKTESYTFAQYRSEITPNDIYIEDTTVNNYIIADASYIETSYPTTCFLYHSSRDFDTDAKEYKKFGDPSMIFIPPLEQSVNDISFLTYNINKAETYHFVNIITKNKNSVYLDGVKINSSEFTNIPNSNYYYARIEINEGSHKLTSGGDGFLAYVYGIGDRIAYGYNVGNTLLPLGAYMLIEGKRVNEMSFCLNEVIDIEGIINYEYDNIEWYMDLDNEPSTVHYSGNRIIQHRYDTTGIYNIKMVVTKKSVLCSESDCSECANFQDIVYAKLRIFDTYNVSKTVSICEGESYNWQLYEIDTISKEKKLIKDTIITTEGTFRETLKSVNGCDSIITLTTKIALKSRVTFNVSECECKLPYKFNEKLNNLTQSGTYYDTLKTKGFGCDSFITVNFTVYPCYNMPEETATVCENDTLEWRTEKYYKGKDFFKADTTYTYYDSLKAKNGCDSVYSLKLYVAPAYNFEPDTMEMCDNEVRKWEGHFNDTIFKDLKAGTYIIYDSLKTKNYGCDSIHTLVLIVHTTEKQVIEHTMCQNDVYIWRDKTYSNLEPKTHIFIDTIETSVGCQCIYELILTVNSIDINDEGKRVLCLNDLKDFKWCNYGSEDFDLLKGDTTYILYDTLINQFNCDSIHKLELYVAPIYHEYDTASICDGDPYFWEVTGETYYEAGDYDATFISKLGCDSILHLHLTVGRKWFIEEDTVNICDNEEYIWEGHKNDTIFRGLSVGSHVFYDSLKTDFFGCDSVHRLVIKVYPTYYFDEGRDTVCITELPAYEWRKRGSSTFNFDLTKGDTTYILYDSLQTTILHACDSVYKLELYVAPIFHKDTIVDICDGDSFYWDITKKFYSTQGIYKYATTTAYGCDSTFTLYLTVNPVYKKDTIVQICHCNPYIYPGEYFKGDTLNMAGAYSDTLRTIHGCDSILNLTLIVDPCFEFIERDTICFNKKYTWINHEHLKITWNNADTTYVYYDSLKTIQGCDSVYILELFIQPTYEFITRSNLCDNKSIVWRGEFIDKDYLLEHSGGIEQDVYEQRRCTSTDAGCDSCLVLYVTLCPTYLFEEVDTICSNQTYTWRNLTLTDFDSGVHTFYDSLKTVMECDSVYQLTLYVKQAYSFVTKDTICAGEEYHFRDTIYTKTGTYYDSLLTHLGCDSVYQLDLFVADTFFNDMVVHICENEEYIWEGHKNDTIFKDLKPGQYICYDSLKTIYGCDSVYHLHLTVNPTSDTIVYDTICCGDYYIGDSIGEYIPFNDEKITKAGTYHDTIKNEYGCDYYVELHLAEIEPTKIDVTILDICADDEYLFISYTYEGRKPIKYSVKFDEDAKNQGFVDVVNDSIDLLEEDSVLLILVPPVPREEKDSMEYPRPDRYSATVFLHNGICSDSLVMEKESFMIRYPSWITEQHWNDVISLLNDKYNGGYTFSKYQWFHNGVPIPGEDSSYIYQPLVMGDEYYAELTRTDDGKTIATCPIYPTMVEDSVIPYPYAEVIPNIVNKNYPYAEIKSVEDGEYWIYNAFALPDGPHEFTSPSTEIQLPAISGVYIIVFETKEHGRRHIQRVIVK